MEELRTLVNEGIYDHRSKRFIQVRIIANLGDNLGQNECAGLLLNFSKMQHSCRKCYCSRDNLLTATEYSDIHAKFHQERTKQEIHSDYLESLGPPRLKHINGVGNISLYHEFPFFDVATQLPQWFI